MDYKVKYTGELTEKDIQDYYTVAGAVFGGKKLERNFKKKYMDNIYGESIIIFCYCDGRCVAVQCFWRNDLPEGKAFQSGDSATLKEYRGRGIFSAMVKLGVDTIGDEYIVYGYPNENSIPAFARLGWAFGKRMKSGLLFPGYYDKVEKIEPNYLEWLIDDNIYFYKKIKKGYLILDRKKFMVYQTLGYAEELSKEETKGLSKARFPICFIHRENGYLGVGQVAISTKKENLYKTQLHKLDVYM
ncbi:MAG: GNAT family N-acetyltransferase [Blautia sp.]|nr:GNAT family N-acetyltransferase [Blautia sp.]